MALTRRPLRRLLEEVLRTDSDFDAFCSDDFGEVYRKFTNGMDRQQKTTMLLDTSDPDVILTALRLAHPQAVMKHEHLLAGEASPSATPTQMPAPPTPPSATPAAPAGVRMKGVKSRQGGVLADDGTGRGVDMEDVTAAKDVVARNEARSGPRGGNGGAISAEARGGGQGSEANRARLRGAAEAGSRYSAPTQPRGGGSPPRGGNGASQANSARLRAAAEAGSRRLVSAEEIDAGRDVIVAGGNVYITHNAPAPAQVPAPLAAPPPAPAAFAPALRPAGAPPAPATASTALSTFISFGPADEAFAGQLHEALERAGIATFFFPKHAELGKPLHRVARDGVNQYDRVLLICSRASLDRADVLNDIEETLRRGQREGGESALIPIALDDHVYAAWAPPNAGTAMAVRALAIGDFRGADRDPAKFAAGLRRLVGALRR